VYRREQNCNKEHKYALIREGYCCEMHDPPPRRHRCWVYREHLGVARGGHTAAYSAGTLQTARACAAVWDSVGAAARSRLFGAGCGVVTQVAVWPAAFRASDVGRQGRRGPAGSSLCQPSVLHGAAPDGPRRSHMRPCQARPEPGSLGQFGKGAGRS